MRLPDFLDRPNLRHSEEPPLYSQGECKSTELVITATQTCFAACMLLNWKLLQNLVLGDLNLMHFNTVFDINRGFMACVFT